VNKFTLGRNTASQAVSFDVGANFMRVSRLHAEISVIGPDRYRLKDLGSTNGTEVFDGGSWVEIAETGISSSQRFRLGGEFETSVDELKRQGYTIAQPETVRLTLPIPALSENTTQLRTIDIGEAAAPFFWLKLMQYALVLCGLTFAMSPAR
jgi:FHA domain